MKITLISSLFILLLITSCTSHWALSGDNIHNKNKGNVGVGTNSPDSKLTVIDTFSEPVLDYTGLKVTIMSPGRARAVYGASLHPHSIENYGGYFTSAGSGSGVFGEASDEEGEGNSGGVFHSYGKRGIGVVGCAFNTGGGMTNYGGMFRADGEHGVGITAIGGPKGYAARFTGNVRIFSRTSNELILELGDGLDIAEGFNINADKNQKLQPGMIVVIDQNHPGKVALGKHPYDTRVAGVVAGANGLGSGIILGSDNFDVQVALAGRVYCFVDATKNAIMPGDLLTTSDIPGYAMKAVEHHKSRGAILGKAMDFLEKGKKGQILVLVTLQ